MATASTASAQELIDQRLDALDRALLGLLPRSERLAIAADVEAKILCTQAADPAAVAEAIEAEAPAGEAEAATPRRSAGRRRSRLALSSGVLGIVALSLLFISPVTYFVIVALAGMLGELFAYSLLGINILLLSLGGAAAVVFGITALVRLSGQQGRRGGHGWAITGLCTGPLPMLVGSIAVLTFGVPIASELVVRRNAVCEPSSYVASATIPPPALGPAESSRVTWTTNAPGSVQPYGVPAPASLPPAPLPPAPVENVSNQPPVAPAATYPDLTPPATTEPVSAPPSLPPPSTN